MSLTERDIVVALKVQRRNLALTQREIAEKLDIPQSTVYRIENFKTSPQLSTVVRYARVVGMKIVIFDDQITLREALKAEFKARKQSSI